MRRFIIEQSEADLSSHSGLALVGQALSQRTEIVRTLKKEIPLRKQGISHADVLRSYIGLICTGKSDFEAVSNVREDDFFSRALGIDQVPSPETLRQRMDDRAEAFLPIVQEAAIDLLANLGAEYTPLETGHVPLDADVTPFDNSKTKKEGVSRTYKGKDGYAPMAAYLGREGYCLEFELREGKQHCQKDTPALLKKVLERAGRLTQAPLLLRLDGGNDAIENIAVVLAHNVQQNESAAADYLIKWNPRKQDLNQWLEYAEEHGRWSEPRPGKRVALFDVTEKRRWSGNEYTLRRVMRVVERRIDKQGQVLLVPSIEIEGWWTSLDLPEEEIIQLYADHGTSEQYHSEFKTDLDIERLPSGKFSTNALVLSCAQLAYNILRWIGQTGMTGPDAPLRHPAKRRRIKTVMQEIIYLAVRMIATGRRLKLAFGRNCTVVEIFSRLYQQLAYG
ncbi:MAG: IS1380 family transposase [bacterium]